MDINIHDPTIGSFIHNFVVLYYLTGGVRNQIFNVWLPLTLFLVYEIYRILSYRKNCDIDDLSPEMIAVKVRITKVIRTIGS